MVSYPYIIEKLKRKKTEMMTTRTSNKKRRRQLRRNPRLRPKNPRPLAVSASLSNSR